MIRASVIVPTRNRQARLPSLVASLAAQQAAPGSVELLLVDDGSTPPVEVTQPEGLSVVVLRREGVGAAAARDAGAKAASGELLVFLDDDMEVGPGFVAAHLRAHERTKDAVVFGRMVADRALSSRPLFERWHQFLLDRMARRFEAKEATPSGLHLFSGNFSLPRSRYLEVGGFDSSLRQSEDVELGLRLEAAGCGFVFAADAWSRHVSDHSRLDAFLTRARSYGRHDVRVSRRHPDRLDANPWRQLFSMHPLARPFLAAAYALPAPMGAFARGLMAFAGLLDRAGGQRVAFAVTSVAYAVQHHRGMREELGSLAAGWMELRAFAARRALEGGR